LKTFEIADELKMLFSNDYAEFVRDRKRWKKDFIKAQEDLKEENLAH
jgi:hypothetical protein